MQCPNIACALLKLTGTILVSAVASPNPSDLYLDTMNDEIQKQTNYCSWLNIIPFIEHF